MTISAQPYLDELEQRLVADGCQISSAPLRGGTALVGRRADFKVRWMATRLHLFTIALPYDAVDASVMEAFTQECSSWAKANKGGLPGGLQTGIAVFPVMVGAQVTPDAHAWASEKQRVAFACMIRPVVVDLASGRSSVFRGKATLGGIYNGHLIAKAAAYFPG